MSDDPKIQEAYRLGFKQGENAWAYTEKYTTAEAAADLLERLEDGDPEAYDYLPHGPLSGEWAGSYSVPDLMDDLGFDDEDEAWEWLDEYVDAFDDGFGQGVEAAIREQAESGRDGGRT